MGNIPFCCLMGSCAVSSPGVKHEFTCRYCGIFNPHHHRAGFVRLMVRLFLDSVGLFALALTVALVFPVSSHAQRGRGFSRGLVVPPDENDYDTWKNIKDPAK